MQPKDCVGRTLVSTVQGGGDERRHGVLAPARLPMPRRRLSRERSRRLSLRALALGLDPPATSLHAAAAGDSLRLALGPESTAARPLLLSVGIGIAD
jgi:hypothetical protein